MTATVAPATRRIGTGTADFATTDTPIGPFTALVDPEGQVLAAGWTTDAQNLRTLIHPSLRPAELRQRDSLGAVTQAVLDYHRGDVTAVDAVPVRQHSGEFLLHAWDVLRKVPAGSPITYTEFAAISGRPDATRAAANACARNAAALFVPCHRIYRIGGALGGFRWGLPIKRWLLDHEA
ncbi:methylated-DNA--[protein]-cysteine S-methyltransferase [Nocardia brasiliensis]|uniref:Putative methylated-DNA:protein-cysteine methyltransferase n=1 Tax=Nocardia brasiliensis (strain ATCC 700358 / HUJEG-1) TaxID=1133849 RepID=K0F728_NOCB7|nr:methylated-DNA--[protein]-cysteine S-methyltransferase [Nocardia brasiliensis]AFU05180.1 putative methylated-DNA:protein-cysteine methyltransferase [Nocardia brasiliensis ATCC 700358]OCF88086.1 cysteine methyltransferase [Nocardia brasiliensis]